MTDASELDKWATASPEDHKAEGAKLASSGKYREYSLKHHGRYYTVYIMKPKQRDNFSRAFVYVVERGSLKFLGTQVAVGDLSTETIVDDMLMAAAAAQS